MIKYFHELTEAEFNEKILNKMTYREVEKEYPQPEWCNYPEATNGLMGCWSLVEFNVTGESFCKTCDLYNKMNDYRGIPDFIELMRYCDNNFDSSSMMHFNSIAKLFNEEERKELYKKSYEAEQFRN